MIVYNVTVKIDSGIEKDWVQWMRDVHIPDVMATGCFLRHDMMKLRYPLDEDGSTYAIQYQCKDMSVLEKYHKEHALSLRQDHLERYGDKALAFRTILEKIG